MNTLKRKAFYLAHGHAELAEIILERHLLEIDERYARLFAVISAEYPSSITGKPDKRWTAVKEIRMHGYTDNKEIAAALWKEGGDIDKALALLETGINHVAEYEVYKEQRRKEVGQVAAQAEDAEQCPVPIKRRVEGTQQLSRESAALRVGRWFLQRMKRVSK